MATRRRRTVQRGVLEELLSDLSGHATAEQLYLLARARLPRISLGTVYRNLRLLVDEGKVEELAGPGGRSLFAPSRGPHHHVRCLSCGGVHDVVLGPALEREISRRGAEVTGYAVKGVSVEIAGFCPECQGRLARPGKDEA